LKLRILLSVLFILLSGNLYAEPLPEPKALPKLKALGLECGDYKSSQLDDLIKDIFKEFARPIPPKVEPLNEAGKVAAQKLENLDAVLDQLLPKLIKENKTPVFSFNLERTKKLLKKDYPEMSEKEIDVLKKVYPEMSEKEIDVLKKVYPEMSEKEIDASIAELSELMDQSSETYLDNLKEFSKNFMTDFRFEIKRIIPALKGLDSDGLDHFKSLYGEDVVQELEELTLVELNSNFLVGGQSTQGMVLRAFDSVPFAEDKLKLKGKIYTAFFTISNVRTFFRALFKEIFGSEDVYFAYTMGSRVLAGDLKPFNAAGFPPVTEAIVSVFEVTESKDTENPKFKKIKIKIPAPDWVTSSQFIPMYHPKTIEINDASTKIEEMTHWLDSDENSDWSNYHVSKMERKSLVYLYNRARIFKSIRKWLLSHPDFDELKKHFEKRLGSEAHPVRLSKERVVNRMLLEYSRQISLLSYRHLFLEIRGKWSAVQYLKKKYNLTFEQYLQLKNTGVIRAEGNEEKLPEIMKTFRYFPQMDAYFKQMYYSKTPPTDLNQYYRAFDFLKQNTELSLKDASERASKLAIKYGSDPKVMDLLLTRMQLFWDKIGILLE